MKKFKTILLKGIFFVLGFQILNLSIDFDYISHYDNTTSASVQDYDDIDSYAEFIVEKIVGNDHYTSENDDDSGQSKSVEKFCTIVLYSEQFAKPQLIFSENKNSSWSSGLDQANKVCRGYFEIIPPPPEV